MYSIDDATAALFKYHTDQGFDECQVMQPSRYGYDDDDGYKFVSRDAEGKVDFTVEFTDDDGNAKVNVVGEESRVVNIWEDADEDADGQDEEGGEE
jgi:hypothetical protein